MAFKLSEVIAKAEEFNLMVSDSSKGGLTLIFASECHADQFCEWLGQQDFAIGINAPYGTPMVTLHW